MKIVMISGKQGSGKSTLSERLKEKWFELHHKNMVSQIKFADVLYEMHDAVLDILNCYLPPRNIVKDGPLLQLLGTEWGRKTIDNNIWVDIVKAKIKHKYSICPMGLHKHSLIIIDDCRFENEFDSIPEAFKIRLLCSESVRKNRCSMWRENTEHPSEIGLDEYSLLNKFNCYLDTEKTSIDECADKILELLK